MSSSDSSDDAFKKLLHAVKITPDVNVYNFGGSPEGKMDAWKHTQVSALTKSSGGHTTQLWWVQNNTAKSLS